MVEALSDVYLSIFPFLFFTLCAHLALKIYVNFVSYGNFTLSLANIFKKGINQTNTIIILMHHAKMYYANAAFMQLFLFTNQINVENVSL